MRGYDIRIVDGEEEIQEALALRQRVFVEEQCIFEKSDKDEHDRKAIYINAWSNRKNLLVGTVRCYPDLEIPGQWWGGRLAVHPQYRTKGIGVYLIMAAVETVRKKQAERFLANVQLQNVELFKKMRWTPISSIFSSLGHPHQTMEADLNVLYASPQTTSRRTAERI